MTKRKAEMTAIVGTINRRGVAFAADSAATHTISSKHKITNHANKLFELSRAHSIGIAICGNLDFLGLPWEEIIKLFRSQIINTTISSLADCTNLFFDFVEKSIMPKLLSEQRRHLRKLSDGLLNEILTSSKNKVKEDGKTVSNDLIFEYCVALLEKFEDDYKNCKVFKKCPSFQEYTYQEFEKYSNAIIEESLEKLVKLPNCPSDFKEKFTHSLFEISGSTNHVYFSTTELVFWGFGDEDIFPSYISFEISAAFDNRMKYSKKSDCFISNEDRASVATFAQNDVALTVLTGVDRDLKDYFYGSNEEIIKSFRDEITAQMIEAKAPQELMDILKSIDISSFALKYKSLMESYISNNYVGKLIDTVAYLSKEDLADMAESLVRMTYLKRRITSEEESVGGPVDVAVITKGDGFIWIKRKHYFDSRLNPHYFERK